VALPVFDRLMKRGENAFPRGAIVIHRDFSICLSAAAALLGWSAHKIDFPRREADTIR
jgi:hypothetical protein